MAKNDVLDLVSENAGKLIHLVGALDQSAIHIDVTARNRKGVYFAGVDDKEPPVEIGAAGMRCDLVPEKVDLSVDLGVVYHRQLLVDLRGLLLAHLHFLLLGDAARRQANYDHNRDKYSFHLDSRGRLLAGSKSKSHSKLHQRGAACDY